jgi:hypothetical protein
MPAAPVNTMLPTELPVTTGAATLFVMHDQVANSSSQVTIE